MGATRTRRGSRSSNRSIQAGVMGRGGAAPSRRTATATASAAKSELAALKAEAGGVRALGEQLTRVLAQKEALAETVVARVAAVEAALAEKDMETKKELDEVRQELLKNMEKIENDRDRISREYQEERKRAEDKMKAMEASLAEEKQARLDRQNEIEKLQRMMEENTRASAEERQQWMRRMEDLQSKQRGGGLFGRIGRFIDSLF